MDLREGAKPDVEEGKERADKRREGRTGWKCPRGGGRSLGSQGLQEVFPDFLLQPKKQEEGPLASCPELGKRRLVTEGQ